ncbi:MAG: PfkB family carbohydrate kinase, partial [bacterium]|nr:PfkB family carbohydrate kinase [bacterium]
MFKKILVTGSLAFDYIMDFPETFEENIIPEKIKTLSVSFLAKNFSKNYGGVAGNIAYNLALLGQKPNILSSCGKMDFETYAKHLKNAGVKTNFINHVENEFSANMFMITDKNNCQIAGFYPGAMSTDEKLLIKKSDGFDFLIVSPTVPNAMNSFV